MTRVVGRGESPSVPRSADVAQLAGVSRGTVSKVHKNEPHVLTPSSPASPHS